MQSKDLNRRQFAVLPDIAGAYCFIVYLVLLLFGGEKALFDGDTLWHTKIGTLVISRGEIITRDLFSHTVAGQPWTSHEWLAEVIMGLLHDCAGLPGVVSFYFLLAALSFWLLFKMASARTGEWQAIFITSIAFALSLSHLLARPHIFTWLLGVITLYILQKGGRLLFLLPLLMVPWANLHGGFALGLVLQGIYLAGGLLEHWTGGERPGLAGALRQHRVPMVVLLLSFLAVGINPFGYHLLLFPFQVSKGSFSTLISEWLAPSLQAFWYFRLYLLFIFFLLFFSGSRISWPNRFALLFFVNASLTHARHISIAGIFLTPFLIEALPPFLERLPLPRRRRQNDSELRLSKTSGPVVTILFWGLLIVLGAVQWGPYARAVETIIPPPEKFSSGVVHYLQEQQPQGKLFNHDEWGDYLIYAMEVPPKVFVDGRLDMYGETILEDYSKIVKLDEKADELLREYGIDWVLFPPSPLTRYLRANGEWDEVYRDSQAVILVRKSPGAP